MKRFTALLLSLLLLFSCMVPASAARMMQTFSNEYFQIYLPGDWVIDLSSVADYYGKLDLGFAYSGDKSMLLEAYLNFYSEWAQDSLWINDASFEDYLIVLMDDFKNESPEMISKFYAGKYPGALLKLTGDYGTYLFGEIMINAYAYSFYFYLLNEDDTVNSNITQDEIELFQSILETFIPSNTVAATNAN